MIFKTCFYSLVEKIRIVFFFFENFVLETSNKAILQLVQPRRLMLGSSLRFPFDHAMEGESTQYSAVDEHHLFCFVLFCFFSNGFNQETSIKFRSIVSNSWYSNRGKIQNKNPVADCQQKKSFIWQCYAVLSEQPTRTLQSVVVVVRLPKGSQ